MPRLALIAALTTLLTPATADARLFWQTYGATVGTEGGCGAGCHWNFNQDYFVPRHCDSSQYGLFSACKVDHTRSAAALPDGMAGGGSATATSSTAVNPLPPKLELVRRQPAPGPPAPFDS